MTDRPGGLLQGGLKSRATHPRRGAPPPMAYFNCGAGSMAALLASTQAPFFFTSVLT